MVKKFIIILFGISFFLSACQKKNHDTLTIRQQKLSDVYVKLFKLRGKHSLTDSVFIDSSRIIFKEYGFTQEQLKEALDKFQNKPKQWNIFLNKVFIKLKNSSTASTNPR